MPQRNYYLIFPVTGDGLPDGRRDGRAQHQRRLPDALRRADLAALLHVLTVEQGDADLVWDVANGGKLVRAEVVGEQFA